MGAPGDLEIDWWVTEALRRLFPIFRLRAQPLHVDGDAFPALRAFLRVLHSLAAPLAPRHAHAGQTPRRTLCATALASPHYLRPACRACSSLLLPTHPSLANRAQVWCLLERAERHPLPTNFAGVHIQPAHRCAQRVPHLFRDYSIMHLVALA